MVAQVLKLRFVELRPKVLTKPCDIPRAVDQALYAGSVVARIAQTKRWRQPGIPAANHVYEGVEVTAVDVPTRQRGRTCPKRPCMGQRTAELFQHLFGELSVGRQLSPKDVEQRSTLGIQLQHIVPCNLRSILRLVVEQGTNTREAPNHGVGRYRRSKILVDGCAQVFDLVSLGGHFARACAPFHLGRPNQSKLVFVGDRKDHAPVGVLKNVCIVVVEQTPHNDVTALYQTELARALANSGALQEAAYPRSRRIDQGACANRMLITSAVAHIDLPTIGLAPRTSAAIPGEDSRTALGGIDRVQDYKPRILHPAVRVNEPAGKAAS